MPMPKDPIKQKLWKERQSKSHMGQTAHNKGKPCPESQKEAISKKLKGHKQSEETKQKRSDSLKGRFTGEEWSRYNLNDSEETRLKKSESGVGGFWYGNVKYYGNQYCELWNDDLRNRIRIFFDNKSVLSNKTEIDNGGRKLTCHHVYYQKKACCEWDEDEQGYYCYIDKKRYDIEGDPNKFVTLTTSENSMVNFNKLKWVKIFEDIIKNKYNNKCY